MWCSVDRVERLTRSELPALDPHFVRFLIVGARLTEMTPRGVTTSTVVVRAAHTFERRRLVDRHRRRAVLVLVGRVGIVDGRALSRKFVRSL